MRANIKLRRAENQKLTENLDATISKYSAITKTIDGLLEYNKTPEERK